MIKGRHYLWCRPDLSQACRSRFDDGTAARSLIQRKMSRDAKSAKNLRWANGWHTSILLLLLALEIRVLRLQPCPRPAAHVSRADALRHNAFEVHPARGGRRRPRHR